MKRRPPLRARSRALAQLKTALPVRLWEADMDEDSIRALGFLTASFAVACNVETTWTCLATVGCEGCSMKPVGA
jgi:hypothetical protein